jgi:hypothetical protein
MRYLIVKIESSEYEPSEDRAQLEAIAAELNTDAFGRADFGPVGCGPGGRDTVCRTGLGGQPFEDLKARARLGGPFCFVRKTATLPPRKSCRSTVPCTVPVALASMA